MPQKRWKEMNKTERDLWRFAIAYYNTASYVVDLEQEMTGLVKLNFRKENKIEENRDWYILRLYAQQQGLSGKPELKRHFSYVDEITGQVIKTPLVNATTGTSPKSLIEHWLEYRDKNSSVICNKSEGSI